MRDLARQVPLRRGWKAAGSLAPLRAGFATVRIDDSADVVIVGGGVMGSSIAWNLVHERPGLKVTVLEKDSSYRQAATPLSVGSIRMQFSNEENIRMSMASSAFIRSADEHLRLEGGDPIDLSFTERGYLFLATEATEPTLKENHVTQRRCGADISLMDAGELSKRFPFLNTEDLAAGAYGESGEGWLDPYSLLMAYRKKAQELGVTYYEAECTQIGVIDDRQVSYVTAKPVDGKPAINISCGKLVNAAGTRAAEVMTLARCDPSFMPPIEARKRCVFMFDCREDVGDVPMCIDPSGVYVRPEGNGYIAGVCPSEERDVAVAYDDFEVDHSLWDEVIWPALANRIPAFEAVKVTSSWAGHYDYNTKDQNAIVGLHPQFLNLYLACGFSGHGLQQSPAIGRNMAQLMLHPLYYPEYDLNLSRLDIDRFFGDEKLVKEKNVV